MLKLAETGSLESMQYLEEGSQESKRLGIIR